MGLGLRRRRGSHIPERGRQPFPGIAPQLEMFARTLPRVGARDLVVEVPAS